MVILILERPVHEFPVAKLGDSEITKGDWLVGAGVAQARSKENSAARHDYTKRVGLLPFERFGYYHHIRAVGSDHAMTTFDRSGRFFHPLAAGGLPGNSGDGVYLLPDGIAEGLALPLDEGFDFPDRLELVGVM